MMSNVDELERVVGGRPRTAMLKSITNLDEHCRQFLAASPFAAVTWFANGARTAIAGGEPGHLTPLDDRRLLLAMDGGPAPGTALGLVALVPGYGETLRINGRMSATDASTVEVEEAFLHCAKAVVRSQLWTSGIDHRCDRAEMSWDEFLASSPFITLGSIDADGHADVSPKGDPPGFVRVLGDDQVFVPDRPGNRRTDTLHNLLDDPRLGLLALIPGDDRVLELSGTATITTKRSLLDSAAVNGRVPKAGILVTVAQHELRTEPGLVHGRPWDRDRLVPPGMLPAASCIWADHVRLNQTPGMLARLARTTISPKLLEKGIARDYDKNLY